MTIKRRIWNVLIGAVMILTVILMIEVPETGVVIAALIFALALVVMGIRSLIYYLTMAKYTVGGKTHLFIGIIILDFGLFAATIVLRNSVLILLFLQAVYGISGAISIVRAREARKNGSPLWKFNMLNGIIDIAIMALAFICENIYRSDALLVYIFSAGLLHLAATRIISAFRKTAVVYIQ